MNKYIILGIILFIGYQVGYYICVTKPGIEEKKAFDLQVECKQAERKLTLTEK